MRWKPIASLAAVAAALLIGCAGPSVPASPTASTTDALESIDSPKPSLTPSTLPSETAPSGQLNEGFGLSDLLRVEVNRLAVRIAPYRDEPLAIGWTLDGTRIGEIRLSAGEFVSVDLGPVQIGDTTWYRVFPAEGGQLHYSTVAWDTKNNGANPVEPAWVASSVGSDTYLTLYEAFDGESRLSGLPLLVSGTGGYVSGPLEMSDLFMLQWVYLIDDQTAPCDFAVILEPVGGGALLVAVETSTIGAFEEGEVQLGAGDGTPIVGTGSEPFQLRVRSDCEWSLLLHPIDHD